MIHVFPPAARVVQDDCWLLFTAAFIWEVFWTTGSGEEKRKDWVTLWYLSPSYLTSDLSYSYFCWARNSAAISSNHHTNLSSTTWFWFLFVCFIAFLSAAKGVHWRIYEDIPGTGEWLLHYRMAGKICATPSMLTSPVLGNSSPSNGFAR